MISAVCSLPFILLSYTVRRRIIQSTWINREGREVVCHRLLLKPNGMPFSLVSFSFFTIIKRIILEMDMETSDPMLKKKSNRSSVAPVLKWKVLAIVFIVISVVLLIALIVVATKQTEAKAGPKKNKSPDYRRNSSVPSCADGMSKPSKPPKSAGVFDDLTVTEITSVRDYLLMQAELNLTRYDQTSVDSNYIYLIQLLPPSKDEALAYLDGDGDKPERKAIAVVFHGATDPPVVREYVVSPASNPNKHDIRRIPGRQRDSVPFNARPFDGFIELTALHQAVVNNASKTLKTLMQESYDGYSFTDCTEKCLSTIYTSPMGLRAMTDTPGFFSSVRSQANTVIPLICIY